MVTRTHLEQFAAEIFFIGLGMMATASSWHSVCLCTGRAGVGREQSMRGNNEPKEPLAKLVSGDRLPHFGIGDIDVAIAYGSADWPGLHCDFLREEEVYLICSPELAGKLPPLKDPDALRDQIMIHCGIESDEWSMWFQHTGQRQPQHCRHLEFNRRAMVQDAVADRMGVALGRTPLVLDYLDDGKVGAPCSFKFKTRFGYSLVYPEPNARYEGVSQFCTWLLREFGHEI